MPKLKIKNILTKLGLGASGLGVIGSIVLAGGICLPCVLAPLGIAGTLLFVVLSFLSENTWIWIFLILLSLLLSFIAKKFGTCNIDLETGKKINFTKSQKKVLIAVSIFLVSAFGVKMYIKKNPKLEVVHCSQHE